MSKKQPLDIDQLLTKICALIVRHSVKDLTYSRISTLTEVPRSTLYYYFGKEIEVLHLEAIRFCMKAFAQMNSLGNYKEHKSWDEYHIQRLLRSFEISKKYPWATDVFFKMRKLPGAISEEVKQIEDEYINGVSAIWKHFHGEDSLITHRAIRMVSYQKLGMIWGMSNEASFWPIEKDINHSEYQTLASKLNTHYTAILKEL